MLLLLVTTPIYLRLLGPDRFGLYMLLVAVVAPFEVLNAGVSQATVKYLAAWLPERRIAESSAMMRIGLLFNSVAGVITVVGLWFAAPWLAHSVFQISANLQADAIVSFRLAAPLWFIIQMSGSLGAIAIAEQNFRLISIVQTARSMATHLGGIPVLLCYGTVASLQTWSILTYLPVLLLWAAIVWKKLGARSVLPGFNRTAFQRSFGFSIWQMMNAAFTAIAQQIDRVLLGILLGTAAVGAYGIATSIQQRTVALVYSTFATLFPAVSRNSATSPDRAEDDIMNKGSILSLLACIAYTVGFWLAAPFCTLWLGADQGSSDVAYLLKILFLVAIMGLPSAQIMQFLLGHGLTRLNFLGNVGMAVSIAFSSYFLISTFGLKGAAVGVMIGVILSRLPLHIWVVWKHMHSGPSVAFRFWNLYRAPTVFVSMLAFTLISFPGITATNIFSPQNIFSRILALCFTCGTSLFLVKFFGENFPFRVALKVLYRR